ncbi:MAG: hypothetical protein AAAB35_16590 [Phyllobacterium sp.]|uniref:hypothetical protein n=1 Tax=Phyllobacterium sp. TaxID=1871046 RepID=UPI0030EFF3C4
MVATQAVYRELIRLQKLTKLRHEMELFHLQTQSAAVEAENVDLFKMHDGRFGVDASIVPVDIIMRRLETNKARQAGLEETAIAERRNWLKVSRTIDTLNRKLRKLDEELMRAEAATELDESISHLLAGPQI